MTASLKIKRTSCHQQSLVILLVELLAVLRSRIPLMGNSQVGMAYGPAMAGAIRPPPNQFGPPFPPGQASPFPQRPFGGPFSDSLQGPPFYPGSPNPFGSNMQSPPFGFQPPYSQPSPYLPPPGNFPPPFPGGRQMDPSQGPMAGGGPVNYAIVPLSTQPDSFTTFQGTNPEGSPPYCRTPIGMILAHGATIPETGFILQCIVRDTQFSILPLACLTGQGQPRQYGEQWMEPITSGPPYRGWIKECRRTGNGALVTTVGCGYDVGGIRGTLAPGCYKMFAPNQFATCTRAPDGTVLSFGWGPSLPNSVGLCD